MDSEDDKHKQLCNGESSPCIKDKEMVLYEESEKKNNEEVTSSEVYCGEKNIQNSLKTNAESSDKNTELDGNTDKVTNTDKVVTIDKPNDEVNNIENSDKVTTIVTLYEACKQGNYDLVKTMLSSPTADVNMFDKEGWSCLHEACVHSCQFTKIAELLLKNGADPNLRDSTGETPLHGAVLFHCIDNVKLLFSYKADFNICNNEGVSPLNIAEFIKDGEILTLFGETLKERAVKKIAKNSAKKKNMAKNMANVSYTPSPLLSPSILKKRERTNDDNKIDLPSPKKSISFTLYGD